MFASYDPLRDSDKPGRGTDVSSGKLHSHLRLHMTQDAADAPRSCYVRSVEEKDASILTNCHAGHTAEEAATEAEADAEADADAEAPEAEAE